jgi:hypothetical protein
MGFVSGKSVAEREIFSGCHRRHRLRNSRWPFRGTVPGMPIAIQKESTTRSQQ